MISFPYFVLTDVCSDYTIDAVSFNFVSYNDNTSIYDTVITYGTYFTQTTKSLTIIPILEE
jgi:hypothetical protein